MATKTGAYTGYGKKRQQQQSPSLVNQYQQMASEAKQANIARETEIRGMYADILNSISGSNASLRASGLADIERQAGQLEGRETQQMISSGMYGTTTAAAIPRNVATSFTQPSRLKLEDLLSTRKREAQLGLAGFVERIENPYPDYNALFQAQIAEASQPQFAQPTQPEQSLSDWMRKEFGPPPGGYTPAPGSFNAPSFSSGSKQTKAQTQAAHTAKYAHVPDIDWAAAQKKAKKTEEELYQGGWLG